MAVSHEIYTGEEQYPLVEDIAHLSAVTDPEILGLCAEVEKDLAVDGNPLNISKELPRISAKYAALIGKLEYLEAEADTNLKYIRSVIVHAFEENPKAFLSNIRHRNMQIVEAVYRKHPQYKEADTHLRKIACMRRIVQQALYGIEHKKAVLETLLRAEYSGLLPVKHPVKTM